MKMFKTMALAAVIASGCLLEASEHNHSMRVTVPFTFAVAGHSFTPGEYDVSETSTGVIMVQGEGKAITVISSPLAPPKPGSAPSLRFRNTPTHDLEAVAMEGETTRSVPVHAERKLTLGSR